MTPAPAVPNLTRLSGGASLKDYISILLRRKWVILVSLASVIGSTAWYVTRMQDIYESFATIVIEDQTALLDQAMNPSRAGRPLSFYEGILNSRRFLEALLDSIGLEAITSEYPKLTRDDALEFLRRSFSLRKTTYSSFYTFSVMAKTRALAYQMASRGIAIFQRQCHEVASEEMRRTVAEIENQLKIVREKLEQAEHDFRSFQERTGDISGGTTPELKTLQKAYEENLAQLGVKEADLEAEKRQLTRLEALVAPAEQAKSPEYFKLRMRLEELEKEKLRLESLGIRLSGLSTVDREIEEIEKLLLQHKKPEGAAPVDTRLIRQWQELRKSVLTKESDLELFKRRLESYRNAIANYKKGKPDLLSQSLELQRLERSKEIYESIYDFLLNKAEEERIRSASADAGVKVVDPARAPDKPIPRKEERLYLIAALFGLALGLGLAFFIEYNDTSLKSTEDIEKHLQLPVLGTIPHISVNKKNEIEIRRRSSQKKRRTSVMQYPRQLLDFSGSDSVITEAYRSLRTNLSFVSPDRPLQTVLITSSGPSEGKSLTITNLAAAHAQMGRRTLLVDTDLRRPILHHLFNMKREPGFTELFGEHADYANSIRPTGKENLSIVTAGLFTPNPAELLASQRMEQHLAYFKSNFDIVFFDTPPVVAVTDAALLSAKVDGTALVIKSNHTDREVAQRAMQSLNAVGAKLVGVVLNDIDLTHRYSSYGYYKYYYHYYKSKTD